MQANGPTGADLQPVLLPVSTQIRDSTPILHAKGNNKRPRQDTPSPQKELTGTDWHTRIDTDTKWAKGQIGKAALGFKTDKIISLAESVKDFMNNTLVSIIERQATTCSDMCTELLRLQNENDRLTRKQEAQAEDLNGVKLCKEKTEVKNSKKEMEERIRVAVTQVKVADLDFGKEIVDRKELTAAAKEALANKVRTDHRKEYDDRIKHATIRILTSKTFKATCDGKDIWTAPILITIPEKENRWATENCLRSSKMFPGFHWPKEMVDNVKIFRKVVKDLGYSDATHYIRIRPDERDGIWKIRADVKPKEGNNKFVSVAFFDIPPLDEKLKRFVAGWEKPTWTRKQAGTRGEASGNDAQPGGQTADVDFTEDDDIYNM
jgi:hypothetical protein